MVVDEEEGTVSVPFLLEDGSSWTGMMGSSRFDGKDGGIRRSRSERARASSTAMGGVGVRATRMSGFHVTV